MAVDIVWVNMTNTSVRNGIVFTGMDFGAIILLIAIFISLPLVLDICLAYHRKGLIIDKLIDTVNALPAEQKKEYIDKILEKSSESATGLSGLARSTMAFTVIFLLGIAVMIVMMSGNVDSPVANNILSILAGTLSAVVGFYFGSRATESATQATQGAAGKTPEQTPGTPANPEPPEEPQK